MKIKHIRKDSDVNAAIEVMMSSIHYQDDSEIGCFWYDTENEELFGVNSVPASSMKFYNSSQFNAQVRTGPKLHEAIWKKEYSRGKDKRFQGDYTQVPRGRVFDLPSNTQFQIDEHWDIGHGWSQEF